MERMKMWLCDRSNAILVTDLVNSRGWEDSCIIAVVGGYGIDADNICMRAVANLSIVRTGDIRWNIKSVKSPIH